MKRLFQCLLSVLLLAAIVLPMGGCRFDDHGNSPSGNIPPVQTDPDKEQEDDPPQTDPDKGQEDDPPQTDPDKGQEDDPPQTDPDKGQEDDPPQTDPDKEQEEIGNRVLIIEQTSGQSAAIEALLKEQDIFQDSVDTLALTDIDKFPKTVDDLRKYSRIILNNISNSDFRSLHEPVNRDEGPDWFVNDLYSYVYDYGGGLFTIGGTEEDGVTPHAYNRKDMYNTLYQDLLPVQISEYAPPVGVMFIIDTSGSMGDPNDPYSHLHYAKEGVLDAGLNVLNDRDYVGVMTLDTTDGSVLPLTKCTESERIRSAVFNIGAGKNTVFSAAFKAAGESLRQLPNVEKRHIVVVTDGMPSSKDVDSYMAATKENAESGITTSVICIGGQFMQEMKELTDLGGGQCYDSHDIDIITDMREDLISPTLRDYKRQPFGPTAKEAQSSLFDGVELGTDGKLGVQLKWFFCSRAREEAEVVLTAIYGDPIYAQWKFGAGFVGSFMCDLSGSDTSWSKEFLSDVNGRRFLLNAIINLVPPKTA